MKKQLSIVLSLLMIVIIAHPSLAMHFCGAGLAEVTVMNDYSGGDSCCCADSGTDSDGIAIEAKNCCYTNFVSLDTDDYQSVTSPSIPVPVDCVLLALFTTLIERPILEEATAYVAPPGVLMADNVSLPFICIFRI